MMADQNCIAAIRKLAPHLSEAEAARIDDDLAAFRKARERAGALDPNADTIAEALRRGDEAQAAAAIEQRNAAINAQKDAAWRASKGKFKSDAEALNAKIGGIQRTIEGAANSVDAQAKALEATLASPMSGELRQAGLDRVLNKDAALDADIAKEMARANGGDVKPTGNKQAEQAAEIFTRYLETARLMMNRAGAWIGKLDGYIVRQSHDQFKIRKAGRDKWLADIEPLLDARTFEDVRDRGEYLANVWTNLASGNHLKAVDLPDPKDPAFKGPGNLAKKLSQGRELIFKSPEAWLAYNNLYGAGSLTEAVFGQLRRAGQATALMREFGTNPQAMFEAWRDRAIIDAKAKGDVKAVEKLSGWRLAASFDDISGAANIPGNATLARWGAIGRSIEAIAKLGGVVLSSLPDIAARAATLRHSGVGLLGSYARALEGHFALLTKDSEKRALAELLGIGADAMRGQVLARFQATDSLPGRMNKIMASYFKFNLLEFWTDGHKMGMGFMLSRNLAEHQGKSFDALPAMLRGNLSRYGIDAASWDAIRAGSARQAKGERFLTPDAVADPEARLKLQTYITDQVAEALNEPTVTSRTLTRLGTQRGTPLGEAVRFFMQFKQFPITFGQRQIGRELLRGEGADIAGLAHLIVMSTALGYVSMYAKDRFKGLEPRDPLGPKTMLAAIKQGGGMGIYGDFLFGDYNRFGGGFLETMAGPAAGSLSQVAKVLGAIRDGEDPSAKALKLGIDHLPFANIFYLRPVLDRAVLFQLQEAVNPGYLKRMEQRRFQDTGQKFIVAPSHTIPRGGGDRLLEGFRE